MTSTRSPGFNLLARRPAGIFKKIYPSRHMSREIPPNPLGRRSLILAVQLRAVEKSNLAPDLQWTRMDGHAHQGAYLGARINALSPRCLLEFDRRRCGNPLPMVPALDHRGAP